MNSEVIFFSIGKTEDKQIGIVRDITIKAEKKENIGDRIIQ